MQRAIKRAVHNINGMRPLDGFTADLRCDQAHSHVDPPYNQYAVFGLDLAGNIGGQRASSAPPNVRTIRSRSWNCATPAILRGRLCSAWESRRAH